MKLLARWLLRKPFTNRPTTYRRSTKLNFLSLEARDVPATLNGLYSTGVAADGQPLAAGSIDTHYEITAAPAGAATGAPSVTMPGFPFPYWSGNSSASAWLSPRADENGPASDPAGEYTYGTTFNMAGLDPATASVTGRVFADNHVTQVLLNGVPVEGFSPNAGGSDFAGGAPLSIKSGFTGGVNSLSFVVLNDAGTEYNPSGFRADLSGTAQVATSVSLSAGARPPPGSRLR